MRPQTTIAENDGYINPCAASVLLVDDEPHILKSLGRMFRGGPYNVLTAGSGMEALEVLENNHVDVMVIDYWMPEMDGLVLSRAVSIKRPDIVKVMLTGCMEIEVVKDAVRRGDVYRYLVKPWEEGELKKVVEKAYDLSRDDTWDREKEVEKAIADYYKCVDLESVPDWAPKMLSMARAVEARDPYTLGHSARVAKVAGWLGEALGYNDTDLRDLKLGALLHDIGKLSVPDSVLFKPARLSKEEFEEIMGHPASGDGMICESGANDVICQIVKHHHENYDGSGYPEGLAGDEIPLSARVVRLADAFDAMYSKRPYRDKMTIMYIRDELDKGAGAEFDPELAPVFRDMVMDRIEEIEVL